jgi:hypothetical protein
MDVARINLEIARGALALAEALDAFTKARTVIGKADCHPSMDSTIECMCAAAYEIPDEYWAIMEAYQQVGLHEIRARLHQAVENANRS